jgi:hypothetical protein
MKFPLFIIFLIVISNHAFATENNSIFRYTLPKVFEAEFRVYLEPAYWNLLDKNRLTDSAKLKWKAIVQGRISQDKEASKYPLNLLQWPTEDKLIFRIGNLILKDE